MTMMLLPIGETRKNVSGRLLQRLFSELERHRKVRMIGAFNEAMDRGILAFANTVGIGIVPIQELRIFLCLLSAFPISFGFRHLPHNPTVKVRIAQRSRTSMISRDRSMFWVASLASGMVSTYLAMSSITPLSQPWSLT